MLRAVGPQAIPPSAQLLTRAMGPSCLHDAENLVTSCGGYLLRMPADSDLSLYVLALQVSTTEALWHPALVNTPNLSPSL